jgi:hypothetical protein
MYNLCSNPVRFYSNDVSDLLTKAITLTSLPTFYVSMAKPDSSPTDTYTSIGAYGLAVANVKRCSIQRNILLSATVHSSVHTPGPFGESSCSIGSTNVLKLGTKGDAHSSLPKVYCSPWRVVGNSVPTQFFRLFLASLYEPRHTSTPTIVTRGCRNWHLRRLIMNPACVSALSVAQVSRQFFTQHVPGT